MVDPRDIAVIRSTTGTIHAVWVYQPSADEKPRLMTLCGIYVLDPDWTIPPPNKRVDLSCGICRVLRRPKP